MKWFKSFFVLILMFSVISFSQRNYGNNLKYTNEMSTTDYHNHHHRFLRHLAFFIFGQAVHNHEHTHDESSTHNSSHSHTETVSAKAEFFSSQNIIFFSCTFKSIFEKATFNLSSYNQPFQIFRPPINS